MFPTLSSSSSNTGDKLQEQEAVATRSSSSSISKMGPAQRVHVITAADALASAAARGVFLRRRTAWANAEANAFRYRRNVT